VAQADKAPDSVVTFLAADVVGNTFIDIDTVCFARQCKAYFTSTYGLLIFIQITRSITSFRSTFFFCCRVLLTCDVVIVQLVPWKTAAVVATDSVGADLITLVGALVTFIHICALSGIDSIWSKS